MQAGKMRHEIVIQKSTYTVDSFGGRTDVWVDFLECWASCRALTGREAFNMQQFSASIDRVFQIRYSTGITPDMRILNNEDGLYHDIVSGVDDDGRRRDLTIYTQVFST